MTYYTNGFLFSTDRQRVALIRKERPAWQRGLFNAIGGHMEEGESPMRCQIREFREEAGVEIVGWTQFCSLINPAQWQVDFFWAIGDYPIKTMTDEVVQWISVAAVVNPIQNALTIPNLRWLIPMVLQNDVQLATVYIKPESHQGKNIGG